MRVFWNIVLGLCLIFDIVYTWHGHRWADVSAYILASLWFLLYLQENRSKRRLMKIYKEVVDEAKDTLLEQQDTISILQDKLRDHGEDV